MLCLASCASRPIMEIISIAGDNFEPGKCYVSLMIEEEIPEKEKEGSFILEIIDPELKHNEKFYSLEELKPFKVNENTYRVQTKPAYSKFVFFKRSLQTFATTPNPVGFAFCLVEVPSEYKTIFSKEIIVLNVIGEYTFCEADGRSKLLFKLSPQNLEHDAWEYLKQAKFQNDVCK